MPRSKRIVQFGPRHTGNLDILADNWDGPCFRARHCGLNDYRSSPAPHAMFMDAMEPQGCFEYVLSGTIYYRIGSERHRIEAGEALVTRRPDPGWMLRPVKDVPVQTLWVTVMGEPALRMFDYLHLRFGQVQRFPPDAKVIRLLHRLVRMAQRQPKAPALVWSERIFRWLNAWWESALENAPPKGHSLLEAREPSRLISYAPRSIKNFAREMGYSRAYLTRRLTQQWLRSPGQVLREVRLQDAARLLSTTRMPIAEIATKVGYSTAASFCRAFHRQYRQSPRQYRQTNR